MLSRWVDVAPDRLALRLRHAFSAHDAARYADALARWDQLRSRWPDVSIAWCGSASNRRELGRVHEASGIIEETLRLFPGDLIAISEAVRVYERLGRTDRVLALSAAMVRLDPRHAQWRLDHFDRLMAAGRVEEASALLDAASDADLGNARALCATRLAMRRGEWATAERMLHIVAPLQGADIDRLAMIRDVANGLRIRHPQESRMLWAHLKRIDPGDPITLHHHADTLIRCGRYDDAADEIAQALIRHHGCDDLIFDRASLALKTERFDDAVIDFRDLLRRRPRDPDIEELLSLAVSEQALALLEAAGIDEAQPEVFAGERQDVGLVEDEAIRRLLLGFESIGQDCEFGLVQRRYGAEPLNLFRWNWCDAETLRQASDASFDGIGDPEHTLMPLWSDYEYYLQDLRWGFAFHTWISKHEADRDDLFAKMCKRVTFMKKKLLADLAAAEKILVHKTFATDIEKVRALLASLRSHGPVRLLWVRSLEMLPSDGPAWCGERVEELEPNLYAGYASRFGNRTGAPWDIAFEDWVEICRAMAALQTRT